MSDETDEQFLDELNVALGHDPDRSPPPERVAALRAAAARMPASPEPVPVDLGRRRSARRLFLAGGIAAGFGGIAGYAVRASADDSPDVVPEADDVPFEEISFDGDAGIDKAGLINHTWGTELVLDVRDLEAGSTYDVVYRTREGEVAAGSLRAVDDVVMKCRFNAAPLRADVEGIDVRDADGGVVLSSDLPTVEA